MAPIISIKTASFVGTPSSPTLYPPYILQCAHTDITHFSTHFQQTQNKLTKQKQFLTKAVGTSKTHFMPNGDF
jgi:hypothetical protein